MRFSFFWASVALSLWPSKKFVTFYLSFPVSFCIADCQLHRELLEGEIHVLIPFVSATLRLQLWQVLSVSEDRKSYHGLWIQGDDDFSEVVFLR